MKKRILSSLLCLLILLSAAPTLRAAAADAAETYNYFITPATSASEALVPSGGSGANSQNYSTYASPVKSVLAKEGSGFTLVTGSNGSLNVEFYDESFQLLSQKTVELPLPIYGGVYLCHDYNFVVCAQHNMDEDNSKEVYRVIRYSKNWDNPVYCSLYGANTTTAIVNYGSLRFARYGDTLLIRTCHEMYRSAKDGLRHQANLTMAVSISEMRITDSLYAVSNIGRGYVSHSFNQFIKMDGSTIVAADHGDAIPRSVVISKYNSFSVSGKASHVEAFPIADNTGHYNTGVSVGGFEISDTHYMLAGNSCPQTGGINQGSAQRNIFVTATSKSNFSSGGTTTSFITSYTQGDNVSVTTPHLVKIDNYNFLLMWGVEGQSQVYMCLLNNQGTRISDISAVDGYLSDCAPICVDGDIFWVTRHSDGPALYRLSALHNYSLSEKAPDCENNGYKSYNCNHCTKSFTITIPALGHDYELSKNQPDCSEPGTATYTCKTCAHSYSEPLDPREHAYGSPEYVDRTCTQAGYSIYTCLNCGFEHKTDYSEPLGHAYWRVREEPGCETEGKKCLRCTICGDEIEVEVLPAIGHSKKLLNEVPGSCREKSIRNYYCTDCGAFSSEEGDYGDHDWYIISETLADCESKGLTVYACRNCEEEKREEHEAYGHDYYVYCGVPAFCDQPGSETKVCFDCGHRITVETPRLSHRFVNNSCVYCGQLAAYSELVSINYRRIKIVLNGEEIIPCDGAGTTVEPFIMSSNGTTYLPLRAIGQALGLNVSWDGVANTVDLSSGGVVKTGAGPAGSSLGLRQAYITYRQIRLFLNGEELSLINRDGNKVEPFILNSNSSVYLPLRIIGEALGLYVSWDGNTSTVYLSSIG